MNLNVINKECRVGDIRLLGVTSSAVFIIGDTQSITAASMFDTPPEAVTFALVPLAAETTSAI